MSESPLTPAIFPHAPARRRLRLLVDHNSCFILSALLMFLGCYLLNTALDAQPADIAKSLALLGAINVYELALIALAAALLPKLSARGRDGALLLFVQFLFLADGPFLIAQLLQVPAPVVWFIALALALLALLKAAFAFKAARLPLRVGTYGFLAITLLLIYSLPIILAHISVGGELPAHTLYLLWWIAGLLPILYDFLRRWQTLPPLNGRQQFIRRSAVIVPWLLLIAHLGFFHYIYRADFVAADLSPVLLGLAVATRRIHPGALLPKNQLRGVRLALPLIALVLSLPSSDVALTLPFTSVSLSPVLLTGAGILITYGYLHSLTAAGAACLANFLMLVGRLFIGEIVRVLDAVLRRIAFVAAHAVQVLEVLLPRTPARWGIIAIAAAFLLLAVGALYSLRPGTKAPA